MATMSRTCGEAQRRLRSSARRTDAASASCPATGSPSRSDESTAFESRACAVSRSPPARPQAGGALVAERVARQVQHRQRRAARNIISTDVLCVFVLRERTRARRARVRVKRRNNVYHVTCRIRTGFSLKFSFSYQSICQCNILYYFGACTTSTCAPIEQSLDYGEVRRPEVFPPSLWVHEVVRGERGPTVLLPCRRAVCSHRELGREPTAINHRTSIITFLLPHAPRKSHQQIEPPPTCR